VDLLLTRRQAKELYQKFNCDQTEIFEHIEELLQSSTGDGPAEAGEQAMDAN
jgi:hypothetical protein